ncbi:MAG: DUF4412 domain-containing protein [Chitinophagaceae bacterium]|jgi:hypothetical protein|nr:DUF4412 domain-containing protein [Chitinophagaceae bacterium]
MTKHLIACSAAVLLFTLSQGQVKTVDKAIVKMKTEVQFPENAGGAGPGGGPGGEGGERIVMIGGPGGMESSVTAYYRGDFSKIESQSDFGNNMVIIDHTQKKTTTLIEAMGRKTGYFSTEEDNEAMRARMDSARKQRRDSLEKAGIPVSQPRKPEIEYIEESKKIAGYTCKKALVKTRDQRGETNVTTVWYCPDFKIAQSFGSGSGGGGPMGRGMMMMGMNGLDQIEGYPMEISMERSNGMKMHTVVTSVKLDASIEDKVFEIPKGYDIKPLKEMQNGDGRVMIRMGGN